MLGPCIYSHFPPQVHRAGGGQEAAVPGLRHGRPRQGRCQGDGRPARHLQQLVPLRPLGARRILSK